MKKVILLSLLVLIALSQHHRYPQKGSINTQSNIEQPKIDQNNPYNLEKEQMPRPFQEYTEQHHKKRNELTDQEKTFAIIFISVVITVSTLFFGFSVCMFIKCMKKRNKRKDLQNHMYMKQMNTAASMGITIHEMLNQAQRPKTIHI